MLTDLFNPRPARVAVFRALQLGDMLCAVPALRALRQFLPLANITLVGLPWAADFARRFRHLADDFIPMPGWPGSPELEGTLEGMLDCLIACRGRRFDVALQMHGSGELSHRLVVLMGAGRVAGFRPTGVPGNRWMPRWPEGQHEIHRYLGLMAFLGVPIAGTHLELPVDDEEEEAWRGISAQHGLRDSGFVCLHPGAQLASRRWPLDRFAAVGRALARDGWRVVVTGTAGEAQLARALLAQLPPGAVDLTGRTSLGALACLLRASGLLVCNDTGISHVAAAVGAQSVVIASGSDVRRWAPLDSARHLVLWQDMPCRPCNHASCPVGHGCALAVTAETVLARCRERLAPGLPHAA